MGKKYNIDSLDRVTATVRRHAVTLLQGVKIILLFSCRTFKRIGRILCTYLLSLYGLMILLFVFGCLLSFGLEIIFYTNSSLILKLLTFLAELYVIYLSYVCFFSARQNFEKTFIEDSKSLLSLHWFAFFSIIFVFLIWTIKQPTLGLYNGYNFKFFPLQLIQENSMQLFIVFLVCYAIVLFIEPFLDE